jgi:hypothetical protein
MQRIRAGRFSRLLRSVQTEQVQPNVEKPKPDEPTKTESTKPEELKAGRIPFKAGRTDTGHVRLHPDLIANRRLAPGGLKISIDPNSPDYARIDPESGDWMFIPTEAEKRYKPRRLTPPTFLEIVEMILAAFVFAFLVMWAILPGTQKYVVDPTVFKVKVFLGLEKAKDQDEK